MTDQRMPKNSKNYFSCKKQHGHIFSQYNKCMYTKQINCRLCCKMQPQIEIISLVSLWYVGNTIIIINQKLHPYLWHSRILRYPARWCRRIDFSWRPIWRLHIEACGQWIYKQQVRCLVKETHQLHCTDVPKKKRAGFSPLAYSRPSSRIRRTPAILSDSNQGRASPLCASTSSSGPRKFILF